MRLPELASIVFLIAGIGLLFEYIQSLLTWEDYTHMGYVGYYDIPAAPEPFILVGLLFLLLSVTSLMYAFMHRNDGLCPWCGQSIEKE